MKERMTSPSDLHAVLERAIEFLYFPDQYARLFTPSGEFSAEALVLFGAAVTCLQQKREKTYNATARDDHDQPDQ